MAAELKRLIKSIIAHELQDSELPYFEYEYENKDKLCIQKLRSNYVSYPEGEEILVSHGSYEPGYFEDEGKPIWMSNQEERFHPDNIDRAIEAFLFRLESDEPYKESGLGQSYEEVFGPTASA